MPLFGKSQKSPAEVVKALKEAVNALERGDKKVEKVGATRYTHTLRQYFVDYFETVLTLFQAQEDVSKNLVHIKNMLYGTAEAEPQTDIVVAQLAQELYNSNLLLLLVQNLSRIDFEVSKDIRNAKRHCFDC